MKQWSECVLRFILDTVAKISSQNWFDLKPRPFPLYVVTSQIKCIKFIKLHEKLIAHWMKWEPKWHNKLRFLLKCCTINSTQWFNKSFVQICFFTNWIMKLTFCQLHEQITTVSSSFFCFSCYVTASQFSQDNSRYLYEQVFIEIYVIVNSL